MIIKNLIVQKKNTFLLRKLFFKVCCKNELIIVFSKIEMSSFIFITPGLFLFLFLYMYASVFTVQRSTCIVYIVYPGGLRIKVFHGHLLHPVHGPLVEVERVLQRVGGEGHQGRGREGRLWEGGEECSGAWVVLFEWQIQRIWLNLFKGLLNPCPPSC